MSYYDSEEYRKVQMSDSQAKFAAAEAERLTAEANLVKTLASLTPEEWKASEPAWKPGRDPRFTAAMFITLWLSQLLTWAWLMMVFRKDVFPH